MITKNFKLFLNNFERQKQFLKEKKLIIQLDYITELNIIEFSIIGNYTYENNICLFSTTNEQLFNKILKYLLNNDFIIRFDILKNE